MAALGAIGVARQTCFARPLDVWAAANAQPSGYTMRRTAFERRVAWWAAPPYLATPVTGMLSGACSKPNARIMLYSRQSGMPIAFTFAAADGGYAFAGLNQADAAGYFAVALDPDDTNDAVAHDRLTPA